MVTKEQKKEYNKAYREKKKLEKEKEKVKEEPIEMINDIIVEERLPEPEPQQENDDIVTISKAELYELFARLEELEKKQPETEKKEVAPASETLMSRLGTSITNSLITSAGSLAVPLLLMGATSVLPSLLPASTMVKKPLEASATQSEQSAPPLQIITGSLY